MLPFTPEPDLKPVVTGFLDDASNTVSYIVQDPSSQACAVFDSVLDIDYAAGRITHDSAEKLISFIETRKLELEWIIETHVHADHLSAAPFIQERLGGKTGISDQITTVQNTFGKIFNEGTRFQRDGSQFDQLFSDGDSYTLGSMQGHVLHTPGHTPACTTHVIGDAAFVGDTLFMPDSGSGRADFPGGDARALFRSMRRVLELPEQTRVFMCHDYGTGGREIAWESTVGEQRKSNIHVNDSVTEEEFVQLREAQDATLSAPRLIIPSLQVNMRAGKIPEDGEGNMMLKVPLNGL